jgi:hypothetical protein
MIRETQPVESHSDSSVPMYEPMVGKGSLTADDETFRAQEQGPSALFQPDILLADHYRETTRKKTLLEPEKELMLAVLEDALYCFQRNIFARTKKEKVLLREAKDWILEENSPGLFSFETICETLNIDPNYLRKGLMDWKRSTLKERRKVKAAS